MKNEYTQEIKDKDGDEIFFKFELKDGGVLITTERNSPFCLHPIVNSVFLDDSTLGKLLDWYFPGHNDH